MNELPCGKCRFYDPILGPAEKETERGWCIPRSTYPYREGPGQVFPPNVNRVAKGELAKPFIVKRKVVVSACIFVKEAGFDPYVEKQKGQVTVDKTGRRVLQ